MCVDLSTPVRVRKFVHVYTHVYTQAVAALHESEVAVLAVDELRSADRGSFFLQTPRGAWCDRLMAEEREGL